ncbi:C39 family peptidase [Thermococcus thermotolerans]|uniref:C39 family peptidase n=1 Tax=Thermococcus thermotolerans TaxID=2969672 RepID=UPI0021582CF5|nr:C39 family peptidase [Thermococcus thermotolerans]
MTAAPVDKPEAVPLATVKALAVRELHKFPEFNGAVPTNPTPLYFPDGRLAAYEFRMVKNGKTIGYIIVSANRNLPPAILEAGFGKKTPSDMMKELAARKGVKTYRFTYLGGLSYGLLTGDTVVNMKGREYKKPSRYTLSLEVDAIRNQKEWESLRTEKAHTSVEVRYPTLLASAVEYKVILTVPTWSWQDSDEGGADNGLPPTPHPIEVTELGYDYVGPDPDPWEKDDGCAPISGAMIVGYYELQYRDSWYREAVIDILHITMDTQGKETSYQNIALGMERFYEKAVELYNSGIISRKPRYDYDSFTLYLSNNLQLYTYIKSEINMNRPTILTSTHGVSEDGNFEWPSQGLGNYHTVAVTGYKAFDDGSKYIYVHTTENSPYAAWIQLESITNPVLTIVRPIYKG